VFLPSREKLDDDERVPGPEMAEAGVPLGPVRAALAGGGLGEDPLVAVGVEYRGDLRSRPGWTSARLPGGPPSCAP
jgi:hypothetical protein